MTDNEIINALECCGVRRDCAGCSKEKEPYGCYFELCGGALDLINRQNAEIERLQHEILSCNTKIEVLQEAKEQLEKDVFNAQMNCDSIAYEYELLKQEKSVVQSEAIKEFAKKVETELDERVSENIRNRNPHWYIAKRIVRETAIEMTEVKNNE